MMIVDPPSGWQYGFPQPITAEEMKNFEQYLLDKGYPEKDIPLAMRCSRYWEINL
jgi:hypothetical protein